MSSGYQKAIDITDPDISINHRRAGWPLPVSGSEHRASEAERSDRGTYGRSYVKHDSCYQVRGELPQSTIVLFVHDTT